MTIPASVTSIGTYPFSPNTNVTWQGNFTCKEEKLLSFIGNQTSYTIPSFIYSIGTAAFSTCTNLISITIPTSVVFIETNSFPVSNSLVITCKGRSSAPSGFASNWNSGKTVIWSGGPLCMCAERKPCKCTGSCFCIGWSDDPWSIPIDDLLEMLFLHEEMGCCSFTINYCCADGDPCHEHNGDDCCSGHTEHCCEDEYCIHDHNEECGCCGGEDAHNHDGENSCCCGGDNTIPPCCGNENCNHVSNEEYDCFGENNINECGHFVFC
jgi:hypothetical protein